MISKIGIHLKILSKFVNMISAGITLLIFYNNKIAHRWCEIHSFSNFYQNKTNSEFV